MLVYYLSPFITLQGSSFQCQPKMRRVRCRLGFVVLCWNPCTLKGTWPEKGTCPLVLVGIQPTKSDLDPASVAWRHMSEVCLVHWDRKSTSSHSISSGIDLQQENGTFQTRGFSNWAGGGQVGQWNNKEQIFKTGLSKHPERVETVVTSVKFLNDPGPGCFKTWGSITVAHTETERACSREQKDI